MLVKIHKRQGRSVVAICDNDLIGKKFEQGKLQLDLTTDFYKGEEKPEQEIKKAIKGAYIINIIGEQSIGFALKQSIIEEKDIIHIKNIPHAQCLFLE